MLVATAAATAIVDVVAVASLWCREISNGGQVLLLCCSIAALLVLRWGLVMVVVMVVVFTQSNIIIIITIMLHPHAAVLLSNGILLWVLVQRFNCRARYSDPLRQSCGNASPVSATPGPKWRPLRSHAHGTMLLLVLLVLLLLLLLLLMLCAKGLASALGGKLQPACNPGAKGGLEGGWHGHAKERFDALARGRDGDTALQGLPQQHVHVCGQCFDAVDVRGVLRVFAGLCGEPVRAQLQLLQDTTKGREPLRCCWQKVTHQLPPPRQLMAQRNKAPAAAAATAADVVIGWVAGIVGVAGRLHCRWLCIEFLGGVLHGEVEEARVLPSKVSVQVLTVGEKSWRHAHDCLSTHEHRLQG